MHLTKVVLKDGGRFTSLVWKVRYDPDIFEHSYIQFYDSYEVFYIKDIESAITLGERISVNRIGDVDEIDGMKKTWQSYKEGEFKGMRMLLVEDEYRLPKE